MNTSESDTKRVRKDERFAALPPAWPEDLLPTIREHLQEVPQKVVVLDDDPTGTQTVHDIPVLTEWPVDALAAELENDLPALYVLTNSRSMPLAEAQALNAEIGTNLVAASAQTGRDFVVVSRSDSTLRGHFPGEVRVLTRALERDFDAWLIVPFFKEGGRYTIDDVHYVADGEWLVPAGETEYARDKTFGYSASNLRDWVEEKTAGEVPASTVRTISIRDIRQNGPNGVTEKLLALPKGNVCIVNAASYRDLEVFMLGLLWAEAEGKRFLYRTAASFVRVRAGLPARPLLEREELHVPSEGGELFVVGSHVDKTTRQIDALLTQHDVAGVELHVRRLLDEANRQTEIDRVTEQTNRALRRGDTVVVYTSRELVTAGDDEQNLQIGQKISDGLVAVVRALTERPRYLVAKGGITSSVVATDGLDVERAMVKGQVLPGVPVWELGEESRYPKLAYVVFPGNVGTDRALVEVTRRLKSR